MASDNGNAPTTTTTAPMETIKLRESNGRREVYDIVRNRYEALTPEEWVRQNVIHRLHEELEYPLELMQVEGAITLNGMTRRCDIVVYDREVKPIMIVECKRENVPITQKVVDQASRYNLVLQVPYLYLTNGPEEVFCKVETGEKKVKVLKEILNWHKLS